MAYHIVGDDLGVGVGNLAPDFEAHTSSGLLQYHEWVNDAWTIIFSHPGTSFPLELLELARQASEFEKRNVKLIGVSSSWLSDQRRWKASQMRYGIQPGSVDQKIQIVADDAGEIAFMYGMAPNEQDPTIEPKSLFVVDPNRIVRLVLSYPATFRKNSDKILQFIDKYSAHASISRGNSPFSLDGSLNRSRTFAGTATPELSSSPKTSLKTNGRTSEQYDRPNSEYLTTTENTGFAPSSFSRSRTFRGGTPDSSYSSESKGKNDKPQDKRNLGDDSFVRTASNTISSQFVVGVSVTSTHLAATDSTMTLTGGSNYVQNALNVLDSLIDIGKVLPYVAPAFILLKVIIEIERNAQDNSARCRDLVERVTFMLSHVPALRALCKEGTGVDQATRQVINRMNNVLKDCTALIEAYRKQGIIARRLSLKNKEKFEGCAQALAGVTNDLLISLQIHQTSQMERMLNPNRLILPKDEGDEEAEAFVNEFGGEEVVKADRELVAMFAEDTKVSVEVNEEVMTELNTNLSDIIRQNHLELEKKLNDSVSATVLDSIKALSELAVEKEKERTLVCVQCDKEFKESTSGPDSCSFHKAEYDSWNKLYACCSSKNPCQFGSHRSKHHCEYPYGAFFTFARNICGYTDTMDVWVTAEDTNLETDSTQFTQVSQLLRWKSKGAVPSEPTILVRVGKLDIKEPYFFGTFTAKDLEVRSQVADITGQNVIFRTDSSETEYAMAEWLMSESLSADGRKYITGIRLTAKAATSLTPFIRVCLIDTQTCTKSGEVMNISEGGLRSFTPLTPYTLPEGRKVSSELYVGQLRPTRSDFKTRTTPNLPIILKELSDPPLSANPRLASEIADIFTGAISVFNKHPPGTLNPISIASVDAYFRFVGDENYTPVESLKILNDSQLPKTIDPRQTWQMNYELRVPRTEEDVKLKVNWWNRAFAARKKPLRLKFVFKDIEDEEASIVVEYVISHYELEKQKPEDIAFFYIDDPIFWERHHVHVVPRQEKRDRKDLVMKICGQEVLVNVLNKVVHSALKSGETEVALNRIGEVKRKGSLDAWSWKTWALVDTSCRRVYAFKILITQWVDEEKRTGYACLGYVPCPEYGDVMSETRPVRYALEKVMFPDVVLCPEEEVVLDDRVDDFVPETAKMAAGSKSSTLDNSGASQVPMALPEEVNQRLASIDNNLERIANAFEQLLDMMRSQQLQGKRNAF
ncbi:hypothetical protein E1B28_009298 [Marasmius oreades]|uniref:Thioredoxin domain-containing protein n=1 Tax=Marasmius oreades TaxID=181124 RepID=A0A9P7S084_9AGAR|nr:uncharacterized protein E1B28_009298 [Marasmius oreades]KAG7092999.1 hypothetical protein E1B28_009298 [Marasmius oreades]